MVIQVKADGRSEAGDKADTILTEMDNVKDYLEYDDTFEAEES